jgi:nucleoside phosphorylase
MPRLVREAQYKDRGAKRSGNSARSTSPPRYLSRRCGSVNAAAVGSTVLPKPSITPIRSINSPSDSSTPASRSNCRAHATRQENARAWFRNSWKQSDRILSRNLVRRNNVKWRAALDTLQRQFESLATRSRGLQHLMVEVADDERDRMAGPPWFLREKRLASTAEAFQKAATWSEVAGSGLPWVHPRFREVLPGESLEGFDPGRVVRDLSGTPRAVSEPMRLRQSYLCGDSEMLKPFEALATAASRVLVDAPELRESEYADDVVDLFRPPRGGVRYLFGTVPEAPPVFIAQTWQPGVLVYEHGVLIDLPIAENTPDDAHWLLLLHRLGWRNVAGSPLRANRLAWHSNMTVPYEWVVEKEFNPSLPAQWRERFTQVPTTSYYSVIGDERQPLDVILASAFAIGLLLSAQTNAAKARPQSTSPDYSNETWKKLPMPNVVQAESSGAELRKQWKPKVVLLTATPTERDTVLKHLEALPEAHGIIRLYHDNNAYFIGRLGIHPVVLCMCSMGGSGRDSAQIVAGEAIRFWKPEAIIATGIAYGREPARQKIGDVLVSERIIAYEPQRVGNETTIQRGQEFRPGTKLYCAFRNADVDWTFSDPVGVPCTPHFGPILSGEKLVDNADFKAGLFEKYPNAIGGEMEGVGVATCADREKCEWIVVKSICDWANGEKSDSHQMFAAAASSSFVRHVLNQRGAISTR